MNLIGIASDHAGFDLKVNIVLLLSELGYEVNDMGPANSDSVDYPDYGISVAQAVTANKVSRGIVICGTGIGMSIVVNRFPGIRGTLCSDVYTAKLCRQHNNSNILFLAFALVSVLGGLAGFLILSADTQVTPYFGLWATFKGLIAMMLGGMGSLPGAILGGLLLGVVEANAFWYGGAVIRDLSAYLLLFVMLIVRPGGLIGQKIVAKQRAADERV